MAENSNNKDRNPSSESEESLSASGGNMASEDDDEHTSTNSLREYMAKVLKITADEESPTRYLETLDLAGVAKYIKSNKCKNIITMAGAGISTSAGIPDFRSPGSGLYDNLEKYNLPHPQAIFEIGFFKENPEPFFVLAKELFPGSLKPTPCHYFLKLLEMKGKLLRHYTQNIDTLERIAGISEDKIVEAHGTFHSSHCLDCKKFYSFDWMKGKIFAGQIPPTCEDHNCSGIVKPDIVFFGERLPERFSQCFSQDFKKCDLLIVLGTSLVVQPFASLIGRVSNTTPRLYINKEKANTGMDPIAALFMGRASFDFDGEDNYRDVFFQSDCDSGSYALADLLGWGEDLKNLVKSQTEKLGSQKPENLGSGPYQKSETPASSKGNQASADTSTPTSHRQ